MFMINLISLFVITLETSQESTSCCSIMALKICLCFFFWFKPHRPTSHTSHIVEVAFARAKSAFARYSTRRFLSVFGVCLLFSGTTQTSLWFKLVSFNLRAALKARPKEYQVKETVKLKKHFLTDHWKKAILQTSIRFSEPKTFCQISKY